MGAEFEIEPGVEIEFDFGIVLAADNSFVGEFELEAVVAEVVAVHSFDIFVRKTELEYLRFELAVMADLQHND